MTTANPKLETVQMFQNSEGGMYLRSEGQPFAFRSDVMSVILPTQNLERTKLVKFTPKEDSQFATYLNDFDLWMEDWVKTYNEKHDAQLFYESLFQTPMKKDKDGNLIVNEEALKKYGRHIVASVRVASGKNYVDIIDGEKTLSGLDNLDIQGYIHPGAQLSAILVPSVWKKDSCIKVALRAIKLKVYERLFANLDFDDIQDFSSGLELIEL